MTNAGYFSVGALNGTWVLLVVDDTQCRTLYRDILEHCGALVTAVGDPDTALAIMRRAKPDVLVAKSEHGVKDAAWLIRSVRALKPEEGGGIPAIHLVGDSERSTSNGYEGELRIPFDSWALCRMISNLVTAP